MNSQIVADLTSAQGHKDKDQPSKPIHVIKTKDIYKFGIKIGSVSVLLNLHNNIVTPGETVAFTAELMNQSKDTIVVAAASISQETTEKSSAKMVKSQEEICSLQGPQCIQDRLTVWTGGLEVRADLLPHTAATFDSFNKDTTVTVQHNFRIIAKMMPTNEILLELQVPIAILNKT